MSLTEIIKKRIYENERVSGLTKELGVDSSRIQGLQELQALLLAVETLQYAIGPTRDVKTPKINRALKDIEELLRDDNEPN